MEAVVGDVDAKFTALKLQRDDLEMAVFKTPEVVPHRKRIQ